MIAQSPDETQLPQSNIGPSLRRKIMQQFEVREMKKWYGPDPYLKKDEVSSDTIEDDAQSGTN